MSPGDSSCLGDPTDGPMDSTPSSHGQTPRPITNFASSHDASSNVPATAQDGLLPEPPVLQHAAPRGSRSTSPLRIEMPFITPAQVAFSALQFLPVPVLVLSGLKTVVLANEAMGTLLGMNLDSQKEADSGLSAMEQLRGLSLSQVGIDVVQGNGPVWINWEQFLNQVAAERSTERAMEGSNPSTPTAEGSPTPQAFPTNGAVIDVVVSQRNMGRMSADARMRPEACMAAKMIVSVWEMSEGQTFFTLTFTNTASTAPPPPTRTKPIARPRLLEAAEQKLAPSFNNPSSQTSSHDSNSSSIFSTPSAVSLSSSPFPPLGPPTQSSTSRTPSLLQKIMLLKDALLDSTQAPILAMWKDGSVTFPNRAARSLFNVDANPESAVDGFDLLRAWRVWSDDFSRELDVSEFPISVLIETQTPFSGRRIGMCDHYGNRVVFEIEGEAVRDDKTGEFLAGVVTGRDVTKVTEEISRIQSRIQAEDEERFRLICDSMPQLVWTATPEGSHDFFNSRWYSYTGLSEEHSLGGGWRNPFHPDDMAETERRWKQSLKTGEPYMTEYRCRSKDGEWRWFLGRALPLRNKETGEVEKWFGTCTDVHESVESKLEAKKMRQQLLSVIAVSHMTMFTVDLESRVTMLEGALIWDSTCDSSSRWYIGQNVYDVFNRLNNSLPEGQMPPFLQPLESVLTGQATEEFQEHEIEGRWYRTRFQPLRFNQKGSRPDRDDAMQGVMGLIMDVTELKAREKRIQAQDEEKRQLVANEAAAKEASRLKSQFLANMSHEIRTPITGVIGMAELLLDVNLEEEEREITENIHRSANALLTVINDILDFSKVESGHLDIEDVQFSLSVVVSDVTKMLSFAAERKQLEFRSDIAPDVDKSLVLMGDPGRVRQIITNLLTNSIKFTNTGYVKFSVSKERETPEFTEVKFIVEDTGIGIEEEVRKHLFQPFSQGDSSTARRFGGTGLGLTICKNLLQLMNGRLSMDSTVGKGTKATFWIPFNNPRASTAGLVPVSDRLQSEASVSYAGSEYQHERAQQGASPWRHPSLTLSAENLPDVELPLSRRADILVLVVEDNAVNQQIAIKTIRKLGFQVEATWNGKEALDYLTAARMGLKKKPEIILMDVQMPIIDGYKCTHLLRHHLPYKAFVNEIPIVAMTASAVQGDKEKCRRAGMDDYLAKPVKRITLERMLVRWGTTKRSDVSAGKDSTDSADSYCSDAGDHCDNAAIPCVEHTEDAGHTEDAAGAPIRSVSETPGPRTPNDGETSRSMQEDNNKTSPKTLAAGNQAGSSTSPARGADATSMLGPDQLSHTYQTNGERAIGGRDEMLKDAGGGLQPATTRPPMRQRLTEENIKKLADDCRRG
ncbi:putative signal transduction histidine-protein kinase [Podospora conica]|nr:putative signal transduction histidine-protein kinase [Schizothecium conicum]